MDTQSCQFVSLSQRRTKHLLLAALCCLVLATLTQAQVVPGTAGHRWVDTGLDLAPGTLVQLSATGQVDVGWGWGVHGPRGTTQFARGGPYPSDSGTCRYGLVARVTQSRTSPSPTSGLHEDWSFCDAPTHCAEQGGHLWLTVNDDDPGNNTGNFMVNVTTTPCAPQVDRARFRVIINGFKVIRPSLDDILQRDGVGDEVLLKSKWLLIQDGREVDSSDARRQRLESRVMGDLNRGTGRVRAGSGQPNFLSPGTAGGLFRDDTFPLDPSVLSSMPTGDRAPMLLFDRELTANQILVVAPTIWEHDGPEDLLTSFGRAFNPVLWYGSHSVAPGSLPEHPGLLGQILTTAGDVDPNQHVGFNIFGDPRDRPIGMRRGLHDYIFFPQLLRFTFAQANQASRTSFGHGPGVIPITYRDDDSLQGAYTIFVQIQRL